jgi:hypothetical protein
MGAVKVYKFLHLRLPPRKRKKTVNAKFLKESCQFEVLNKVYLQNFLHGCAVNRETNLMSLLNPCFATVMLQ